MTFSIDQGIESENGSEMQFESKSPTLDPEERMLKKHKAVLMHEVVDKLKPRYRRLVELRYFQERSYDEIATELQLPLGTVKAQLFRAREFLYQILKTDQEKI